MKRPILVLLAAALLNFAPGVVAPAHAAPADSDSAAATPVRHDDGGWYHHRYRDRGDDWYRREHRDGHDWYHHDRDRDRDDYHDRYRDHDHDRDRGEHHGRQHCGGGLIVICLL